MSETNYNVTIIMKSKKQYSFDVRLDCEKHEVARHILNDDKGFYQINGKANSVAVRREEVSSIEVHIKLNKEKQK